MAISYLDFTCSEAQISPSSDEIHIHVEHVDPSQLKDDHELIAEMDPLALVEHAEVENLLEHIPIEKIINHHGADKILREMDMSDIQNFLERSNPQ